MSAFPPFLIMTNGDYFALAMGVFTAPGNPGATHVQPDNSTAARVAEANRAHMEAIRVYSTYNNVDQAFKKLIIDAFEDQFLNALSDKVVGDANHTSLDLLTHLLTYYATIAPNKLTQNYDRLNTPYDPNQPTESLFQQIQYAWAFAIAGGQPYGDAIIVNVAYTIVFNTGLFPDACRAWQVRPAAQKSLTNLKIHFAAAHREFSLTNQTAHNSEFHSARMMIEHHPYQGITDAILQLAVATASDNDTVATLTDTNARLTLQLETSQAYVKNPKEDIVQLKIKIKPAWQGQRPAKTTNNDNYCWSHGYQVHNEHTSASCKNHKKGHKKEATKTNPMGGVKWGKEWCGWAAKVLDQKLDQFANTLESTPPTSSVSMNDTAILDSGCTSIFLSATAPCLNKRAAHVPLHVNIPFGTTIKSSHTSELLLSALPRRRDERIYFPE
jgi:hypothetical protein